ncbi:MAG: Universal stress protein family 4, partial [uncultured Solirubrobacterales bacterium]
VPLDRGRHRRLRDRRQGRPPGRRARELGRREPSSGQLLHPGLGFAPAPGAPAGAGGDPVVDQPARGRRGHIAQGHGDGERSRRERRDLRARGGPRRRHPRCRRGAERRPRHGRQPGDDRGPAFPARERAEQDLAPLAVLGAHHPDEL